MRTGFSQLPLHSGRAPRWLFERMTRLAREIICHLVSEYGAEGALRRLADPFWFQAFGCVLGFDWHSSGVTTTTCGAVKEGIKGLEHELGFYVAGGKGRVSRKTPEEIQQTCEKTGYDAEKLVNASRLSAKVDSSALQDGYQIYHHAFFFSKAGRWCVVQQGMNEASGMARRYHWLGDEQTDFVNEPHAAVCCDHRGKALNFVARESKISRERVTQLAAQPDREVEHVMLRRQELLMPKRHWVRSEDINPKYLHKILLKTYEQAPADFASLLAIRGVGPKTLRALALTAELIYGTKTSVRDPARFSFAHGGKDGTPFPVDRENYDKTIEILHAALHKAKVDRSEKLDALKRLGRFNK
ncbi:DUF763 domain-containing protein [Methylomarinum sp. Ch1-1]|uniref:DUF763 domain-containing protein n=1 Tax=Methylomarinum roseum TaxID=3067653 RepID=A0AAU7NRV2_9GAMM